MPFGLPTNQLPQHVLHSDTRDSPIYAREFKASILRLTSGRLELFNVRLYPCGQEFRLQHVYGEWIACGPAQRQEMRYIDAELLHFDARRS